MRGGVGLLIFVMHVGSVPDRVNHRMFMCASGIGLSESLLSIWYASQGYFFLIVNCLLWVVSFT